jgi:L-asparaginase
MKKTEAKTVKKIALMTTGGTIASVPGKTGLAPQTSVIQWHDLFGDLSRQYTIEICELMNIDSTNMQPENWQAIARAVYRAYPLYDGMVITHGTDTMAYTAAALSYMLKNPAKPIVLTGSMRPVHVLDSDAKRNLQDALLFAANGVGGVFVVFAGKVIRGTRASKVYAMQDRAFVSVNDHDFATIDDGGIHYHANEQLPKNNTNEPFSLDDELCPDVILVKLHPGTKPELFEYIKAHYKGVVIESYGSGGIPFIGRDLLKKIKELKEAGIPVVVTTQCLFDGVSLEQYEVGKKAAPYVISAQDMTTEAAVAKLMWVLGKRGEWTEIKHRVETPIANDRRP